jgi:hypothetical protein
VPTAILMTLLVQGKITIGEIRITAQSPYTCLSEEADELYRAYDRGPITIARSR